MSERPTSPDRDTVRTLAARSVSRRLATVNLLAQLAFSLLAMTICLPSMQQWPTQFAASQATIQLTFSVFLVFFGAMQLIYGPLSDRHGRRKLLLVGLGVAFCGMVMAALATRIEVLILARAIQGAGCAAAMAICRATVQDLYQGPERTRIMAFVGMTMGLCPPTATVLGGQLHVHAGWQSNFVLLAVLAALLMLAAWRTMPPAVIGRAPNPQHWWRASIDAYACLARERAFLLNVVVLAASTAAFYAYLGGAPAVLGAYGVGPDQVGFFIMMTPLSYIVGNYACTRLVHRLGEVRMRRIGLLLSLAGIVTVLLLALVGVRSPLALSVPLTLLGIGHGLLLPPTLAATVGLVPALAGAAAGASGLAQQMVGALGGYVVGWVPLDGAGPLAGVMLVFSMAAAWANASLVHDSTHRAAVAAASHTPARPS